MEAATGGAPAADATQLQQAVDSLSTAVTDMQQRVNQDLESLKNQVNQANASPAVDLTEIIASITSIQETVTSIDPASAVEGGATGPQEPAPAGDATATAAGDQGQVGDSATPEAAAGGTDAAASTATSGGRTVYTLDGDPSTVDASQWPRADVNTEDGRPLFYYAGDTNPGDANGDGQGGVWHRYDGPEVAAGSAADTGGAAQSAGETAPGA